MERISYDFSSSDEDMSSTCSDEVANGRKFANRTDKDEENADKKQNVVYKLINREVIRPLGIIYEKKLLTKHFSFAYFHSKPGSFRIINELNRNRMPIAQCQID